jgi:outer membrane receptor protein involved in Fe transport
VDFRYETPNFNLNPEKSYNTQVGFKYKNNKLQEETYFYRNELRNIIARVWVDTQNKGGRAVGGFECKLVILTSPF